MTENYSHAKFNCPTPPRRAPRLDRRPPLSSALPRRFSGQECASSEAAKLSCAALGALEAPKTPLELGEVLRPVVVAAQERSRFGERRIGYLAVRSNKSHAEFIAHIVSRQRIRERTAAAQIDSKGRVRAIVGGRRRAGGVGAPKLEDIANGKRIEDAAVLPRRRRVVDQERGGRGAEEGGVLARRAAQLDRRIGADLTAPAPPSASATSR